MDNNLSIYDDFLTPEEFQSVKEVLLGGNFPWFLHKVVPPNSPEYFIPKNSEKYNFQFSHGFYANQRPHSEHFPLVQPILSKLNPLAILRIKANLTIRTPEIIEQGYHTDYESDIKCITGVFYVNTTDGYTKFKTGEVVNSVENRLVLFDSRTEHTGTTCTDSDVRCVINFNFLPRSDW